MAQKPINLLIGLVLLLAIAGSSSLICDERDIEFQPESMDASLARAKKENKLLLCYIVLDEQDGSPGTIGQQLSQTQSNRDRLKKIAVFSRCFVHRNGEGDITDAVVVSIFNRNKLSLKLSQPFLVILDCHGNILGTTGFPINPTKVMDSLPIAQNKAAKIETGIKNDLETAKKAVSEFIKELNKISATQHKENALYLKAIDDIKILDGIVLARAGRIIKEFNSGEKTKEDKTSAVSKLEELGSAYKTLPLAQKAKDIITKIKNIVDDDLEKAEKLMGKSSLPENPEQKPEPSPDKIKQMDVEIESAYKKSKEFQLKAVEALNKLINTGYAGYESYENALLLKGELKSFIIARKARDKKQSGNAGNEPSGDEIPGIDIDDPSGDLKPAENE